MDKLELTYVKGKNWKLIDEYETFSHIVKERIVVNKGFKTDLASVPQAFWNIFPPFGEYIEASIVHDYLYRKGKYNRKICDRIFLELMKRHRVGYFTRQTMYRAVRMFGKKHYRRCDVGKN